MRCAERDTHEWNPITSLIQCHSLTVGQTPNLLRIVFTITRSEPAILLTSRIVGECSYSTRSRIIGSVFEHLFTNSAPIQATPCVRQDLEEGCNLGWFTQVEKASGWFSSGGSSREGSS